METLISINEHTAGTPIYIGDNNENVLNINDEGLFDQINRSSDIRTAIQDARCLTAIMENDVEIEGIHIKFTDNLWDLSSAVDDLHHGKGKYVFNFGLVHEDYYNVLLKLFIYNLSMQYGINRPSTYINYLYAREFFNYLESRNISAMERCSVELIHNWLDAKKLRVSVKTLAQCQSSLKALFAFYYNVTGTPIDQDILDILDKRPDLRAATEEGKLDLLPYSFMHKLCTTLFQMFDEEQNSQEKRELGLLCISTQSGLRPTELLNLETDCVEQATVDGMPVAKLRYRATKQRRGKGFIPVYTVANSKVVHVVNEMKKYCAEEDKVFSAGMDETTLNKALRTIVHDHAETLGCITDEPDPQYNGKPEEIMATNGKTHYINYPVIKQFRVYLSSE